MSTSHQLRCLTTAIVIALLASGNAWSVTAEEADSHYRAEEWSESVAAYEALVKENRNDARALYRLAVSLRHAGDLDKADKWLNKAEKAGVPLQYILVEQAHIKLLSGSTSAAIASLDAAEIAGLADPAVLTEDEGFEVLQSDVRFKALVERVKKNQSPCNYDKSFREFDFWIGEWRVVDANGVYQGTNNIQKQEGGCLLLEKWASASGSTGTSMNFYDASDGQWVQHWVSPSVLIDIRGGIEGNSMVLTGNIHYLQSDQDFVFRGTWTPQAEGVVRQHFEQSPDMGETWATWFDGYYHPATAAATEQ